MATTAAAAVTLAATEIAAARVTDLETGIALPAAVGHGAGAGRETGIVLGATIPAIQHGAVAMVLLTPLPAVEAAQSPVTERRPKRPRSVTPSPHPLEQSLECEC